MPSPTECDSEQMLKNLVHDLRQPLGIIETSAYYLRMLLCNSDPQAQAQIESIGHQVERAAGLLNEAVAELNRRRLPAATPGPAQTLPVPPAHTAAASPGIAASDPTFRKQCQPTSAH